MEESKRTAIDLGILSNGNVEKTLSDSDKELLNLIAEIILEIILLEE